MLPAMTQRHAAALQRPAPLAGSATSPLHDRLLAAWSLDEASGLVRRDRAGQGIDLDGVGALPAVPATSGRMGSAARFIGNGQRLFTTSDALNFAGGPFFISAWFRYLPDGAGVVFSKWDNGDNNAYTVQMIGDSLYGVVGDAEGTTYTLGPVASLVTFQWYHVVLSYDPTADGAQLAMYVNLSLLTREMTAARRLSSAPFTLGARADDGALPLNGAVDEVCAWGRAATPADVIALYQQGAGLAYPFVAPHAL